MGEQRPVAGAGVGLKQRRQTRSVATRGTRLSSSSRTRASRSRGSRREPIPVIGRERAQCLGAPSARAATYRIPTSSKATSSDSAGTPADVIGVSRVSTRTDTSARKRLDQTLEAGALIADREHRSRHRWECSGERRMRTSGGAPSTGATGGRDVDRLTLALPNVTKRPPQSMPPTSGRSRACSRLARWHSRGPLPRMLGRRFVVVNGWLGHRVEFVVLRSRRGTELS